MKKPFGLKISLEPYEYCKGTISVRGGYEKGTIVVNSVPAVLGAEASVGKFGMDHRGLKVLGGQQIKAKVCKMPLSSSQPSALQP